MERDAQLLADNISSINNFNSHAHVERDNRLMGRYMGEFISTHTLTWSVTGTANATTTIHDISTHTLTWSVTFCER